MKRPIYNPHEPISTSNPRLFDGKWADTDCLGMFEEGTAFVTSAMPLRIEIELQCEDTPLVSHSVDTTFFMLSSAPPSWLPQPIDDTYISSVKEVIEVSAVDNEDRIKGEIDHMYQHIKHLRKVINQLSDQLYDSEPDITCPVCQNTMEEHHHAAAADSLDTVTEYRCPHCKLSTHGTVTE